MFIIRIDFLSENTLVHMQKMCNQYGKLSTKTCPMAHSSSVRLNHKSLGGTRLLQPTAVKSAHVMTVNPQL